MNQRSGNHALNRGTQVAPPPDDAPVTSAAARNERVDVLDGFVPMARRIPEARWGRQRLSGAMKLASLIPPSWNQIVQFLESMRKLQEFGCAIVRMQSAAERRRPR